MKSDLNYEIGHITACLFPLFDLISFLDDSLIHFFLYTSNEKERDGKEIGRKKQEVEEPTLSKMTKKKNERMKDVKQNELKDLFSIRNYRALRDTELTTYASTFIAVRRRFCTKSKQK